MAKFQEPFSLIPRTEPEKTTRLLRLIAKRDHGETPLQPVTPFPNFNFMKMFVGQETDSNIASRLWPIICGDSTDIKREVTAIKALLSSHKIPSPYPTPLANLAAATESIPVIFSFIEAGTRSILGDHHNSSCDKGFFIYYNKLFIRYSDHYYLCQETCNFVIRYSSDRSEAVIAPRAERHFARLFKRSAKEDPDTYNFSPTEIRESQAYMREYMLPKALEKAQQVREAAPGIPR